MTFPPSCRLPTDASASSSQHCYSVYGALSVNISIITIQYILYEKQLQYNQCTNTTFSMQDHDPNTDIKTLKHIFITSYLGDLQTCYCKLVIIIDTTNASKFLLSSSTKTKRNVCTLTVKIHSGVRMHAPMGHTLHTHGSHPCQVRPRMLVSVARSIRQATCSSTELQWTSTKARMLCCLSPISRLSRLLYSGERPWPCTKSFLKHEVTFRNTVRSYFIWLLQVGAEQ